MNFNEILKDLRKSKGITQKELSKDLNYSQSVICEWEKGTTQPTAIAILTLAKYFDVTTDYLLGVEENFNTTNNEHSIDEQKLIKAYRAMTPGKKKALFSMLDIEQTTAQTKKNEG